MRKYLTSSEAAEYIGVSVNTLHRYDHLLNPARLPLSGHRRYSIPQLDGFLLSMARHNLNAATIKAEAILADLRRGASARA